MAKFLVYRDSIGQYRWRFQTETKKIVADSTEGYNKKTDALNAILIVKREVPGAAIEDPT